MEPIINKVADSGIISFNLEDFYPKEEIKVFDLKDFLFMGLILKEKDYRLALQQLDWEPCTKKNVAITCTADAIIPVWAYMLAAVYLQPIAASVYYGTAEELTKSLIQNRIAAIDKTEYTDKRVVIKGCGDTPIPEIAYVSVSAPLLPVVKSLMYGEPCSMVPIYKKK